VVKQILLTGGTGLVGSAFAAASLAAGHRVLCLARNDPDGERTWAAIVSAAEGFGITFPGDARARLVVENVAFERLAEHLTPALLRDVDEVWHAAAEMSFSPHRVAQSFHQNVTVTALLHLAVSRHAPRCRRFYYVSTAFTAGNAGGDTYEMLHTAPILINGYQISKWGAEMALAAQHARGVPVTLVRTTGVVGHRQSAWCGSSHFGLYLFVDLVASVRASGGRELCLDVRTGARPNLVPIDSVIEVCTRLSARDDGARELEIFHCVGEALVTTGEMFAAVGDVFQVPVRFESPKSAFDEMAIKALAEVRPFVEIHWQWDSAALARALPGFVPPPVDVAMVRRFAEMRVEWPPRRLARVASG
jgi:nucleoside-diphosphate-sugar epimerase